MPRQARQFLPYQRQNDKAIGENRPMAKPLTKAELRQIVGDNIRAAIERSESVTSINALAKKAGVSQSNLSEAMRNLSALTTDTLAEIAACLDCQPWELLANTESTRKAALERMLGGPVKLVPNRRVEEVFPPVPKSVAAKRKRR